MEVPFEPLVQKTSITISTMEESTLFIIQSMEKKLRPYLDRDLSYVKIEAREVVPMVSKKCMLKEAWVGVSEGKNV